MPAVSILMVFHRDSPFLRPAIASALDQTWRDLELVLVDNGTGMSPDKLGKWGADPRLRWVRLPGNVGIPGGHNAGVAAATGEFVVLLDYDDMAKPGSVERQIAVMRHRPEVALVSGLAERIDENGRVTGGVFCLPRSEEHEAYSPYGAPVVLPAAMVRRDVLAALPYRKEFPFAADLDFQARFVERWRMLVIPEVLLSYRWYPSQTTQQRRREIEQSRCVIQLAAARRRTGAIEDLPGTLAITAAPSAGETWRRGARVCLAERRLVYAAYQARRSLACERTVASAARAGRLAWRALTIASRPERPMVAGMFFRGPVRALRLHPA